MSLLSFRGLIIFSPPPLPPSYPSVSLSLTWLSLAFLPKASFSLHFFISSFLCITNLSQVEQYDPSSDKWSPTTSMIEHRSSVGIGVLDGFLYAVGGYNGQVTVNTAERYNPRTGEWNMITQMNTVRSMLGVASLNGQLYAIGRLIQYSERSISDKCLKKT